MTESMSNSFTLMDSDLKQSQTQIYSLPFSFAFNNRNLFSAVICIFSSFVNNIS